MKQKILVLGWFAIAIILSSCVQIAPTESIPTKTPSATDAETQTPQSSTLSTSIPIEIFTAISPFGPISYMSYEQVYIDPLGQYAVKFSADWKPTDKPNSFAGYEGFFETGYLPNWGFISRGINVCVWLANMDPNPEQKAVWLGDSYISRTCTVMSTSTEFGAAQEIYENHEADYEHRYIYLKARAVKVPVSFWWLKPTHEKEPKFSLMPLRPEDDSFWAKTTSIPAELSVTEYILPPEAQTADPAQVELLRSVPPEALSTREGNNTNTSPEKPAVNEQLRPLGYELRTFETSEGQHQELYRDGRILFDNVYKVSDVYTYAADAGPITAFTVDIRNKPDIYDIHRYLIQNDAISELGYNINDPPFDPILYKGELLWVRAAENAHVQVQKSNQEVVFSFATYFGTHLPVNVFQAWNDHWILEVGDFVIQDGEILNEKFGFEEVFNWRLIRDKPIYFFRKGRRMGLSYNGQFFSLNYEDVARGFCCGLTGNNPGVINNTVRFFGKRDGVWYYGVVEVR